MIDPDHVARMLGIAAPRRFVPAGLADSFSPAAATSPGLSGRPVTRAVFLHDTGARPPRSRGTR